MSSTMSPDIQALVVYALTQAKPDGKYTTNAEYYVFGTCVEELSKLGFIPHNEFQQLMKNIQCD